MNERCDVVEVRQDPICKDESTVDCRLVGWPYKIPPRQDHTSGFSTSDMARRWPTKGWLKLKRWYWRALIAAWLIKVIDGLVALHVERYGEYGGIRTIDVERCSYARRVDIDCGWRWWQILQDSLLFDGLIAARRGTKGSKYCWQIWLIDLSNNWLIERAMQLMNAIQRDRGLIPRRSKLFYISTYIIRDDREF